MSNELKIPFEQGNDISNSPWLPSLQFFQKNRAHQMKYTKKAVESGAYRNWIEQLTDEELQGFIDFNNERIASGISVKIVGPSFRGRYFWRNVLYSLELLHREHGEDIEHSIMSEWTEMILSEKTRWETQYKNARVAWLEREASMKPEESASVTTPYY